ncbi:hypothetical protein OPO02_004590 [Salmonella enterica]|jgi:flagellar biosynthesis regulator FlaF|uniref:hypothetical protein n=1 Tax=Enterobacterales TaxID=91347 RepID=UPI000BE16D36|nr:MULTISPECIES: hypothetical protein [Enterobacterales]EKB8747971.1 hypothetical protein [Salmonella enterica]HAT3925049.1 hypothetical protein [Citrobacter amalonaticus]EKB8749781.1 hypothetical protein [Salmonella enterica]EKC6253058.1 hypothetical protein [Escherichia coli]MBG0678838.1 hypothetical protein [Enterobacter bugandensis]
MAKHLTRREINYIVGCITNWDDSRNKLTWDNLCTLISRKLGRRPTRQALNTHKEIVDSLRFKKKVLKREATGLQKPDNLISAQKRIATLEIKVKELEMANKVLHEENVKLNYCCYLKGITENELNSYFPEIDRCN